jgi:serine/threonine-protein kinase
MRPHEGDLINGKYRLVRLIGDGGMGSVFEARHEHLGTTVALKFLHPELAKRQQLVARFVREAQLSATIQSNHVAHVTDIDQSGDGLAYLVMELLQGDSLQTILTRDKKLPTDIALDYTMQILAGLEAAHERGVVHRDLKPDNVFVVPTARGPLVKLLDFGIAKLRRSKEFQEGLTRPGVMMGTPEYMAPEQAYSAESVDARADVYSVGAMLYEMLAGTRPTQGDDAQQIAAFIMTNKVVPLHQINPAVSEGLAQVVHRAMAAAPEERFASAADLRSALLPFCGNLSLEGRLAATPAPGGGVASPTPAPGGGVAPTLPPEADGGLAPLPAMTQPRTPIAATPVTPMVTPQTPAWMAAPTPPAPAYGYQPVAVTPTRSKPPRSMTGWLIGGLVLAAAAAGAVAITMSTSRDDDRSHGQGTDVGPTPIVSAPTATAAPTPQPTLGPPIQPVTTPVTPATAKPVTKPKAGGDASVPDAATSATPPVFTVPGLPPITLPPFPSALPIPPLPSGFPPIPPNPGFPAPAPAPSH